MEKSEVKCIVVNSLEEYLDSQDMEMDIKDSTTLFGPDSVLDSIGLVNIVIDIESKLADKGIEISLTSAEAMSRKNSPFRNVLTLINFIVESLGEENE